MKHIWIMVMLKICKHTFYAYVSRIWKLMQFTCFIRKVFATKILLSGKFLLFVTLKITQNFSGGKCGRIQYYLVKENHQDRFEKDMRFRDRLFPKNALFAFLCLIWVLRHVACLIFVTYSPLSVSPVYSSRGQ